MSDANKAKKPPKRRRRAAGVTGASRTPSGGARAAAAKTKTTTPKKPQPKRKQQPKAAGAAKGSKPKARHQAVPDVKTRRTAEPPAATLADVDTPRRAARRRAALATPLDDNELRAAALAVSLQLLKRAEAEEARALTPPLNAAPAVEHDEFEPPFDAPTPDEDPLLTTDADALSHDGSFAEAPLQALAPIPDEPPLLAADTGVLSYDDSFAEAPPQTLTCIPDEAPLLATDTDVLSYDDSFAEAPPEALASTSAQEPSTPIQPPEPPSPPLKSGSLEYLNKARHAALEEAAAIEKLQRSRPRQSLWATATGIAAPLLALGAFVVFNNAERADTYDLLSPASAEAHAPDSQALVSVYQVALQRIEDGQLRDGAAILRQAADGGLAIAQYRLAKLYERGEGVRRDLETAFSLSELAARGGNCRAMHDAGVFLARGEGTSRNEGAAFGWFLQAAELGVADSQYNVGLLYEQGRGVDANAEEALYWFLVAARQHDLNAIDRAVLLAAEMRSEDVARARARAHAFSPQAADAMANGVFDGQAGATCAND